MEEMKNVDSIELTDEEVEEVVGGFRGGWEKVSFNPDCPKCGGSTIVDGSQPPYEPIPGRGVIVLWKCENCGHKWESVVR